MTYELINVAFWLIGIVGCGIGTAAIIKYGPELWRR